MRKQNLSEKHVDYKLHVDASKIIPPFSDKIQ